MARLSFKSRLASVDASVKSKDQQTGAIILCHTFYLLTLSLRPEEKANSPNHDTRHLILLLLLSFFLPRPIPLQPLWTAAPPDDTPRDSTAGPYGHRTPASRIDELLLVPLVMSLRQRQILEPSSPSGKTQGQDLPSCHEYYITTGNFIKQDHFLLPLSKRRH